MAEAEILTNLNGLYGIAPVQLCVLVHLPCATGLELISPAVDATTCTFEVHFSVVTCCAMASLLYMVNILKRVPPPS
jgi:hypothetical protein